MTQLATIKYRNGIPTKSSIEKLTNEFFGENKGYKIRCSAVYGKKRYGEKQGYYSTIIWQDKSIQEEVLGFIDYLASLGVEIESYKPYNSPMVGSIDIKSK